MTTKSYSWINQELEVLCYDCCKRFLPLAEEAYKSNITKLYMPNPPDGIPEFGTAGTFDNEKIYWEAEEQEFCISPGYPPKCSHCGLYMLNYDVFCVKNRNMDCGCRSCKPHIYEGREDLYKNWEDAFYP